MFLRNICLASNLGGATLLCPCYSFKKISICRLLFRPFNTLQRSWGKVMFSQVSVCQQGRAWVWSQVPSGGISPEVGGCVPGCDLVVATTRTVSKRTVRILLKCFLLQTFFTLFFPNPYLYIQFSKGLKNVTGHSEMSDNFRWPR